MAGFSVTLLRLDDELTALWDAPVHTPPCAGASDPRPRPAAAAPAPSGAAAATPRLGADVPIEVITDDRRARAPGCGSRPTGSTSRRRR